MKHSDKVLIALNSLPKDKGKKWLSEQLGISRPTLNQKLYDNGFSDQEVNRLKQLGIINH